MSYHLPLLLRMGLSGHCLRVGPQHKTNSNKKVCHLILRIKTPSTYIYTGITRMGEIGMGPSGILPNSMSRGQLILCMSLSPQFPRIVAKMTKLLLIINKATAQKKTLWECSLIITRDIQELRWKGCKPSCCDGTSTVVRHTGSNNGIPESFSGPNFMGRIGA